MARRRKGKIKLLRLAALTLGLAIMITASVYAIKVTKILGSDLVYENIYLNDELVSGMTYDQLKTYLYDNYQNKTENISFEVKVNDKIYKASLKDFDVKYDIESTVDKIYTLGREGSILQKLALILKIKDESMIVPFEYTYDKTLIDAFVDKIYREAYVEKLPSYYTVKQGDLEVELSGGHRGQGIDKDKLKVQIKEIVENARNNEKITVQIIYDDLEPIDGNRIFDEVYVQAKNASCDIIGKELSVNPHKVGQEVNKDTLREAINYINSNEDSTRVLDIEKIYPEITTEIYESNLFTSVLGSAATQFSTNTENTKARAINITKATGIINGTLIAPGQTFSFNGVVGPRSVELGYAIAHVYESGKVVNGVGGGICQVSSTLYNAVLYADLEVTDRRNHMFIVPYVPLGADATVDYGSQDFKFVNNTDYPIRVEGIVSADNKVKFSIVGTDPDPSISIEIRSVTLDTIPFEVKYVDDPTLATGTQELKQEGMNGYVAEAFKEYYRDGEYIKEVSIGKSTYKKLDEIINVGTN
jgi:vancomycin resistance protein YoaR